MTSQSPDQGSAETKVIRVAIFEDNPLLLDSLEQLVNSTVDLLCTGAFADALHLNRKMEAAAPEVVVMDIDMPGISGIEAVRSIRAGYPTVKVLMQTVFEGNDKIFAAICAGASGYLLKKSSPSRILDAIRETHQGGAPMTGVVAHKLMEIIRQQAPPQSNPEFIDLSAREKEILALLVQGRSYKSVAAECHISIDTVNTHVRHIYEKLQVHSKSEAVAKAIHQKLV